MDYYFISDNKYLLLGLEEMRGKLYAATNIIYACNNDIFDMFNPAPGDIVLLAVSCDRTRRTILRRPVLAYCRLIIMVGQRIPNRPLGTKMPWIISLRIRISELVRCLHDVATTDTSWLAVPDRVTSLFFLMAMGVSVSDISKHFSLTEKRIYAIRQNFLSMFGMSLCNTASGILFCRDIMGMLLGNNYSEQKLPGPNRGVRYHINSLIRIYI